MFQRYKRTVAPAVLVILLVASAASAESFVCSVQSVTECSNDGYCGPPNFAARPPATFILVDTGAKQITLLAPEERRGETTDIQTQVETQDGWLFAGVEAGRSWCMQISGSGDVTMSITMDGAVWSGFGKWMPAEYDRP